MTEQEVPAGPAGPPPAPKPEPTPAVESRPATRGASDRTVDEPAEPVAQPPTSRPSADVVGQSAGPARGRAGVARVAAPGDVAHGQPPAGPGSTVGGGTTYRAAAGPVGTSEAHQHPAAPKAARASVRVPNLSPVSVDEAQSAGGGGKAAGVYRSTPAQVATPAQVVGPAGPEPVEPPRAEAAQAHRPAGPAPTQRPGGSDLSAYYAGLESSATVAFPAGDQETSGSLTGHILAQGWADTAAERSRGTLRVVILMAVALGVLVAISVLVVLFANDALPSASGGLPDDRRLVDRW